MKRVLWILLASLLGAPTAFAQTVSATSTFADPYSVAGIADALAKHNAALPKDAKGNPIGAIADGPSYLRWVMKQAAISWCNAKVNGDVQAATAACLADSTKCANAQALLTQQQTSPIACAGN